MFVSSFVPSRPPTLAPASLGQSQADSESEVEIVGETELDVPRNLLAMGLRPAFNYEGVRRIEEAIKELYLRQGLRVRGSIIDRALNECIAGLRKALFEQDRSLTEVDYEKMESWLRTRRPLIGRLQIFAKQRNNASEMIEELRDSYNRAGNPPFAARTIERLIDTVLVGNLEGVDPINEFTSASPADGNRALS